MPLSDSLSAFDGSGDGVAVLVRGTAEAWCASLGRQARIEGFFCGMRDSHGMQTILASGVCAPLGETAGCADRIADAFGLEVMEWQGMPEDLARRFGLALPSLDAPCLVVHPLRADGHVAGLLVVAVSAPPTAVVLEEWRLTFLAAATVAALYREHEAQRAQADALRALDAITQAISRETDTQSLYGVIHREVSKVMACDAFYVGLFDGVDRLDYVYRYDQGVPIPPIVERLGAGPSAYCIRERRPFILSPENAAIHDAGTFLGQERRSASAIHVPLLVDGEPIGVLSAQSYQPDAYEKAHVQLLEIIAAKAATAVRNTELLERIRSQVESLKTLTRALQIRDQSLGLVDDLVLTTDPDGNITAYNEAVGRTLGYGPTELLGQPIISLRPSGRGHWEAFRTARNRSVSVSAKDGRGIPVMYSTEPLLEQGQVIGYLTIAKDLSDLHRSADAGRVALSLERRRISRDLHDGLIQSLSIAKMQLQLLQRQDGDAAIRRDLADLQETLSRGLAEARHYIVDLKHSDISQEGLVRAARRYAHDLGRVAGFSIGVSADTETSPLCDGDEVQMFFILREALNNVRKHADARRVRIEFRVSPDEMRMSVEDDGKGFDPAALPDEERDHWGLKHIRERARDLGGRAEVSSAPGSGTRVSVFIGLPRDGAERSGAEGGAGGGAEGRAAPGEETEDDRALRGGG